MSWEAAIETKLQTATGERVIHRGSNWIHQIFLEGKSSVGPQIKSCVTGKIETIKEIILPAMLVDSSVTYNGQSNALMAHLVAPEFRHLLPAEQSYMPPWEISLTKEGTTGEKMYILAGGLSESINPVQAEITLATAAA